MIRVQKIELKEATTLLQISCDTFFTAFAHLNTVEDMEAYAAKAFTPERINTELTNPDSEFYFAYLDNNIAGYLKLNYRTAQTEYQGDDAVEVERVYVVAQYQNQKLGAQLLAFAEDLSRQKQLKTIWLGVWEHNTKARRFYERQGFIQFGSHQFMLGGDEQTDLLLKKQLI